MVSPQKYSAKLRCRSGCRPGKRAFRVTILAVFTPVRQSRASGEIVSQIERAVFAGELETGDRLQSERELAEQFGVSRITVRDALRVLEARGLIRVKVGAMGGAFVADANTDRVAESISTLIKLKRMTLSELAEARTIVEAATASLAAQRADAGAVSRLQQHVERARPLLREPITHADASMDFHVELARAARNEVLEATVEAYRELLVPSIRDLRDEKSGRATQKAHEEIVEAVRRHDSEGARELMLTHLADFEKRLRRSLATRADAAVAGAPSAARHSLVRIGAKRR
jgi:GntR family transcriptional repressor for pyruvate dehydrogenase complex